jgi:3-mercaptopyruvate sulfurtransferase SseA
MKNFRTVALAVAAVVVVLLAAFTLRPKSAPAPAPPAPHADGVARTSPRELASMIARGEVIVIDVRDADAYIAGHIEGALHIPLSYIAGEVPYLRKGKRIVTYCT